MSFRAKIRSYLGRPPSPWTSASASPIRLRKPLLYPGLRGMGAPLTEGVSGLTTLTRLWEPELY